MKAMLTYKEMRAIWNALSIVLQHGEQPPLATESMETAFEKVERVTDDMRYRRCNNTYFLITPVGLEEKHRGAVAHDNPYL